MTWQDCHVPDKRKLPLYGPLDIKNGKSFLENSKQEFDNFYHSVFPFNVKVNYFQCLHEIGHGGFGRVTLVKYKLFNSYYAMKSLEKKELVKNNCVKKAFDEKRILQSVNSPFCIHLIYFSQDKSYIYFILPFISGGDLYRHLLKLVKFDNHLTKFYAAQVFLGLEYLHSCGVIYRDLKPENVLLDHYGFVKLADFGLAKVILSRTYTFCGTMDYIAPEVITGKGYAKAADWWSFGAMVFEMASGHPPFFSPNHLETFDNILSLQYRIPKAFCDDLKDFIANLLQTDVTKRLGNLRKGPEEVKDHRWFNGINWLELLNRKVAPPYVPAQANELCKDHFPDIKEVFNVHIDKEELGNNFWDF